MGRMTAKQFGRYLERDQGRCYHCGTTDTLVPNHRANRGAGGSKLRERPSNVVTLCSRINGEIEADALAAAHAVAMGWKLRSWDDPLAAPVWDTMSGTWWLFGDNFERVAHKVHE